MPGPAVAAKADGVFPLMAAARALAVGGEAVPGSAAAVEVVFGVGTVPAGPVAGGVRFPRAQGAADAAGSGGAVIGFDQLLREFFYLPQGVFTEKPDSGQPEEKGR